jgi:hypothetical protein
LLSDSGRCNSRFQSTASAYLIGAATTCVFGFLYFGMVDTASPLAVFVAIVLSLIPHDMQYGPQAALIAEAFTPRLRYSGASLGVSAGIGYRRRPGTADRYRPVRDLSFGLCDIDLYRGVRGCGPVGDGDDARLHRQGHLGRI